MRSSQQSPVRARKTHAVPHGFLSPKSKQRPITDLTIRELHDLHHRNAKALASPYVHSLLVISSSHAAARRVRGASTSTRLQRISAEQKAIKDRLLDLEGMDLIQAALRNTRINGENDMKVDMTLPSDPAPLSRAMRAKQKALAHFVR
jgi:hypothetical protein